MFYWPVCTTQHNIRCLHCPILCYAMFLQCIANPDGGGCKIDCGPDGNRYMKDDSHEKEKVIDLAPGDKGSKAVKLTLQLNG